MKRLGTVAALALGLVVLGARPAHAYIDPSAGSLLLQLLLGGVAGLAVIVKLYWRRITSFFGRSDESEELR